MDVDALRSAQHHCETLFQCPVCWLPKLEMVYGTCQHRVCVDCVYCAGVLRSEFSKCPTCNQKFPFPLYRPIIPDDNIEVQKKLGITRCQNSTSCKTEMWLWEIEEHNKVCKFKKPKKAAPRAKAKVQNSKPENNMLKTPTKAKPKPPARDSYPLRHNSNIYDLSNATSESAQVELSVTSTVTTRRRRSARIAITHGPNIVPNRLRQR